jgi:phosphomannomutase/phosphoglucomutase
VASAESEDPPAETTGRARKPLLPDFAWFNAGMALAIAGAGLLIAFLMVWWQLVERGNARHEDALLAATDMSYVAFFNSRIGDLERNVKGLAEWPPVVGALKAGDRSELDALSGRVAGLVPYALRVAVVPRGEAQVDLKHEIPISYAALDMIRRAEHAPLVGPEVSLSQRNQVAIAAPVHNAAGLNVGTLFLVVSTDFFGEPLRRFDLSAGQIRIQQTFADAAPDVVMQFGSPGSEAERRTTTLAVPHWQLLFDPGPALAAPLASATSLTGPLALAAGLLLGGVLLAASRHRRKLKDDLVTLSSFATRLLGQPEADPGRFHLPEFRAAAEDLARSAARSAASGTKPEPRARRRLPVVSETHVAADRDKGVQEDDFLEVNVADDAARNFGVEVDEEPASAGGAVSVEDEIFRAYDIRGIVERNLGEVVVYWIGRAFAAEARAEGQSRAVVGGDGRLSSPILKAALAKGLNQTLFLASPLLITLTSAEAL